MFQFRTNTPIFCTGEAGKYIAEKAFGPEKLELLLSLTTKGCHGQSLDWKFVPMLPHDHKHVTVYSEPYRFSSVEFLGQSPAHILLEKNLYKELIEKGAKIEIDYLDLPLFEGLHFSIKNADTCGCGKSFS